MNTEEAHAKVEEASQPEQEHTSWVKKPVVWAIVAALVLAAGGGSFAYYTHKSNQHAQAVAEYTSASNEYTTAQANLNDLITEAEGTLTDARNARTNPQLVDKLQAALEEAKKQTSQPQAMNAEQATRDELAKAERAYSNATKTLHQTYQALEEAHAKVEEAYNTEQQAAAGQAMLSARRKTNDALGNADKTLADTKDKVLDEKTRTRLTEARAKLIQARDKANALNSEKVKDYFDAAKTLEEIIPSVVEATKAVNDSHAEWLKKYQPAPTHQAASPSPESSEDYTSEEPPHHTDTWTQAPQQPTPTPGGNTNSGNSTSDNGGWVVTGEEDQCWRLDTDGNAVEIPCH